MDEVDKLQGVKRRARRSNSNVRRTIAITLVYKHFIDDQGIEYIEQAIAQTSAAPTQRTLDWKLQSNPKSTTSAKWRRVRLEDIHDEYMREGWLPEAEVHGLLEGYREPCGPGQRQWQSTTVSTERSRVCICLVADTLLDTDMRVCVGWW